MLLTLVVVLLGSCRSRESFPPQEQITLSYFRLGWSQPDELPIANHLSEEFTRQTGIRIRHTPVPETSLNQLDVSRKLLAAEGSTPDVFGVDVIWSGVLDRDLIDLRPYFAEEIASMDPQLISSFSIGDKLVAIPYQIQVGVIEYRTDLLREYGYERPPRTWDELEKMALKIQSGERGKGKKDFWGFVWQGAAAEALTCNGLEWQAAEGGGQVIEADQRVSVNNPATVRAWQRARRWIGRISPPSVIQYREFDSMNVFDSGRAAFHRTWGGTTRGAVIKQEEPSRHLHWRNSLMDGKVGYAGMPGGAGGRFGTLGGSGLGVSRRSQHKKEAIEFIRFLIRQQITSEAGMFLHASPRAELYDLPTVLDSQMSERQSGIVSRPSTMVGDSYDHITRAYIDSLHSVLIGKRGAADAAADLERQLVKITGFGTARRLQK
jgi:trehalose/maltose transport system substrate-binding protein